MIQIQIQNVWNNLVKDMIRKTKMQMSFLLLLFTFLAISYAQISTVYMQDSYCSVLNLSTPELIMRINPDEFARNRSTQTIVRTQSFEVQGNKVSLAYIIDDGNLMIQETGANLISTNYTEEVKNNLIFIDSRDQYIIAIEATDPFKAEFSYALLQANFRNSPTLSKFTISSLKSGQNSITDLKLKKIVEISNNFMYFLMQGNSRTSIFKLDLLAHGDLIFVADLSKTTALKIVSGNSKHLYEAQKMMFYELSGSAGSQIYTPTTLSSLNIDSIIDQGTLKFTELGNLVLLSSTLGQQTIIIPIDNSPITSTRAIKIKGTSPAKIYTDNLKNLLAVTDQDFVWIRSTSSGMIYNQYSLTLPIRQRDQLQAIFLSAKLISFDRSYALVLSKNLGTNVATLASVLYDPTKYPYFTIADKFPNALNLQQQQFTQIQNTLSVKNFITSFRCNCVVLQAEKIDCFGNTLKCITVTKPIRVDCTKSA